MWDNLTAGLMSCYATGDDGAIPIVAPSGQPCLLRDEALSAWMLDVGARAPNWPNRITAESRVRVMEYTPAAFIDAISPRPLLMLAMSEDSLIPLQRLQDAFARAGEPKRLEVMEGGHMDPYTDPLRSHVMNVSIEWLTQHGVGL